MAELFLGCATLSSNWARVQVERWWWDMHPGLQRLAAVIKAVCVWKTILNVSDVISVSEPRPKRSRASSYCNSPALFFSSREEERG
jgi:hypothetical protein